MDDTEVMELNILVTMETNADYFKKAQNREVLFVVSWG